MLATQVAWAPFNFNHGSTPLAIVEAHMVLFQVKWLGRLQRGTAAFQESYSSHLCGTFFHTLALEYDMHLAMQCSSILAMQCSSNSLKSRLSNANCVNCHQGSLV